LYGGTKLETLFGLSLIPVVVASGAAAWMPESFAGNHLYCDGRSSSAGTLYYSSQLAWTGVLVDLIEKGIVECGDLAAIQFEDGRLLFLPVLDASELHVKESYLGVPFVVELPEHVNRETEMVEVVVWRVN
jgi:hypothetical protein